SFFSPVLYQLSYLSGSFHYREIRATVNGRERAMICDLRPHIYSNHRTLLSVGWLCIIAFFISTIPAAARAGETSDSPNVRKVVNAALKYLEDKTDERLGGKCLIALAFLKAGKLDHPKIREAAEECAKVQRLNPDDGALDNYSN